MDKKIGNKAKEQFGRVARNYIDSSIHASTSDLEFVCSIIAPQSKWDVLDIATGTGHLAHTLSPYVHSIIASDITPEMLEQAQLIALDKKLPNITIEKIDVHKIPYDDNTFDLVTSRIAPHHFTNIKLAISEMVRVIRPGGHIFIQDTLAPENEEAANYFNAIEKLRDQSHVRDLSLTEWIGLLQENNCIVNKTEKRVKHWNLKRWTERMSTPWVDVKKIIDLLEKKSEIFGSSIEIVQTNPYERGNYRENLEKWTLNPYNGYFMAIKQ